MSLCCDDCHEQDQKLEFGGFCTSHGGAIGILSRSEVSLLDAGMGGGVLAQLQGYICHLASLLEIKPVSMILIIPISFKERETAL